MEGENLGSGSRTTWDNAKNSNFFSRNWNRK